MKAKKEKNRGFEEEFEKKVLDTIDSYNLFTKNDKVLVACSGGKDSTTILYILKKHGFDVAAITVDTAIGSYTKQNLKNLREFCRENRIKLYEKSFRKIFGGSVCYIKAVLKRKGTSLKSCTICGVLRRYILNKEARRIRPKCIVTGHNMDDEAQSIMMNFLRNRLSLSARLGPKTGIVEDKRFVPRVKPLYFCSEKEAIKYSKMKKFNVNYSQCPCRVDSYRREVLGMLDRLEKNNPKIKQNIIENYLKILPRLKKGYATNERIAYCRNCGEPSKGEICKTCSIISMLGK